MCTVRNEIASYLPDLQRFALSLVGARQSADADDLVQNCVQRALTRADQFEEGTNLKAWLFTMMRNIFISQKRHDRVRREHAQMVIDMPEPAAPMPQAFAVMLGETWKVIETLSEDDQAAIRDLAINELPQDVVARRLNVPVGTLKSRLSRSRGKLRRAMDMDGAEDLRALSA